MKRRWFQLHLSTTVFITLVAGVLVGVNVIPRTANATLELNIPFKFDLTARGWPYPYYIHPLGVAVRFENDGWIWRNMVIDAVVSMLCICVVVVACELPFRRREARKP